MFLLVVTLNAQLEYISHMYICTHIMKDFARANLSALIYHLLIKARVSLSFRCIKFSGRVRESCVIPRNIFNPLLRAHLNFNYTLALFKMKIKRLLLGGKKWSTHLYYEIIINFCIYNRMLLRVQFVQYINAWFAINNADKI